MHIIMQIDIRLNASRIAGSCIAKLISPLLSLLSRAGHKAWQGQKTLYTTLSPLRPLITTSREITLPLSVDRIEIDAADKPGIGLAKISEVALEQLLLKRQKKEGRRPSILHRC
jgi:hypothetical protein